MVKVKSLLVLFFSLIFFSLLCFLLKQDVEGNLLSSIYHTGQLVSCIVLQLDDDKKEKGKRLWLSLRLALLHKGLTLDVIQEGMVCHYLVYILFVGIILNVL